MRRILVQAGKELAQTRRDRLAVALALILPSILLVLLGTAISLDVRSVPLAVQDLDRTPMSRQLIDAFHASLSFQLATVSPEESPETVLLGNRARGVLVIPPHFERDFRRSASVAVQVLVDATDSNTATLVRGKTKAIAGAFSEAHGRAGAVSGVVPEVRFWFNPGLDSRKFYGPGSLVLALAIFPPLLAAISLSREGEQKTILQVYVSSISAHEFLLGKILAGMVVGGAEWLVLMAIALPLFGVGLIGDPSALFAASVLFILCGVCLGVLIGASIPSQAAAVQALALISFLFSMLLSGLIFPIENIPPAMRWFSNLVQARYYVEVVRDGLLRGGGWRAVWASVLAPGAIAAVFYTLAWLRMRRMELQA